MSGQSDLSLPPKLPFPVKVVKRLVRAGDKVERGTPLLTYSFNYKSPDHKEETLYGTWESHVEGSVDMWIVDEGEIVGKEYGPVIVVTEPCKHGLQIGGLCALCGKDMTFMDYIASANSERARIQMDHSGGGPLFSREEAMRLERQGSENLLKRRKLTLIVDLDQTIIHATMDPTVGEWMNEKRLSLEDNKPDAPSSLNWPALDDVVQFQLGDDPHRGGIPRPDSPWYYIKPRPGLTRFMSKLGDLYEMHVYTMGTRSYADAVCATLDTSGKWFGSRVLTRSESGNDRVKSLTRLFPTDQSMVVVIDDRADVWDFSPNLVKVTPFEFFVGTGDINSATLKEQEKGIPGLPVVVPPEEVPESDKSAKPTSDLDNAEDNESIQQRKEAQDLETEKELKARPLAKALDDVSTAETSRRDSRINDIHDRIRTIILNNDDNELDIIESLLTEVHTRFYEEYDAWRASRRVPLPDVSKIIPSRMKETFRGLHICFSGVIPIADVPETTPVWKTAIAFGATCHRNINAEVTHLVTSKPGTAKMDAAIRAGNIHIVWLKWFSESIVNWKRQPEAEYVIESPRARDSRPASGERSRNSETPTSKGEQVSNAAAPTGKNTHSNASELKKDLPPVIPLESPPTEQEPEILELEDIDWAEIDKEIEEAMSSEDEDENGKLAEMDEDKEASDKMESTPSLRGLKRRRSEDPRTPERKPLGGSEDTPPASKKVKLDHFLKSDTSVQSIATLPPTSQPAISKEKESDESENDSEEDSDESSDDGENDQGDNVEEDDDDFLARGMREGETSSDSDDD